MNNSADTGGAASVGHGRGAGGFPGATGPPGPPATDDPDGRSAVPDGPHATSPAGRPTSGLGDCPTGRPTSSPGSSPGGTPGDDDVDVSAVIRPELVSWDIQATTKEQALTALCATLAEAGLLTDPDLFYRDVLQREEEGPTSLGNGVAIPHGKSSAVTTTCVALGRCREPLPWADEDEPPVRIVFLLAVRLNDAATTHLRLLQLIATCLADDAFTQALSRCATGHAAYTLLTHRLTQGAHS